jgi:hypothetical protein
MDAPKTDPRFEIRPHVHAFHGSWMTLVQSHKTALNSCLPRDAFDNYVKALDALALQWRDRVCTSHNEEKGLERIDEAEQALADFEERRALKMLGAENCLIDPNPREVSLTRYYQIVAETAADLAKFVADVGNFYKSDVV